MMNSMPGYKNYFKQDIIQKIKKKTVDYTRNIFLPDLIDEAVYYSADMCLEFYNKSGNILPQNWIDHIVDETCAAFKDLFHEFDTASGIKVHSRVDVMLVDKYTSRQEIDAYYDSVNRYYVAHR